MLGDAPASFSLYNEATGNGYDGRIFMGGEEVNNAGRAFGHLFDGTTDELPALGKAGWENQVATRIPATGRWSLDWTTQLRAARSMFTWETRKQREIQSSERG